MLSVVVLCNQYTSHAPTTKQGYTLNLANYPVIPGTWYTFSREMAAGTGTNTRGRYLLLSVLCR